MRPPTAKLTFETSCSDRNAPDTRSDSVSYAGLDRAGRLHDVLRLQRRDQEPSDRCPRLASSCIENSTKIFSSCAPRISIFETSRTLQQLRADVLDVVAKLAMREPVGREAVDDPERVAELVVEARPDDARRQGVPDIADALADMIPDVGNFPGGGAALQIDEDRS